MKPEKAKWKSMPFSEKKGQSAPDHHTVVLSDVVIHPLVFGISGLISHPQVFHSQLRYFSSRKKKGFNLIQLRKRGLKFIAEPVKCSVCGKCCRSPLLMRLHWSAMLSSGDTPHSGFMGECSECHNKYKAGDSNGHHCAYSGYSLRKKAMVDEVDRVFENWREENFEMIQKDFLKKWNRQLNGSSSRVLTLSVEDQDFKDWVEHNRDTLEDYWYNHFVKQVLRS